MGFLNTVRVYFKCTRNCSTVVVPRLLFRHRRRHYRFPTSPPPPLLFLPYYIDDSAGVVWWLLQSTRLTAALIPTTKSVNGDIAGESLKHLSFIEIYAFWFLYTLVYTLCIIIGFYVTAFASGNGFLHRSSSSSSSRMRKCILYSIRGKFASCTVRGTIIRRVVRRLLYVRTRAHERDDDGRRRR